MTLSESVVQFLQKSCEGLLYDQSIAQKETTEGKYYGRSIKPNQIPYNMQKDNDRKAFVLALSRFLDSGSAKDAFDVYFCFIEMFLTGYDKTVTMISLLSEYEQNTSNVVMKHRDHYSHSVYVFALGLAFYENNSNYRKIYSDFYKLADEKSAAHHFLRYWGMTSLFHDIGYPFELPFEQVAAYFEIDKNKREGKPYLAYQNLDEFRRLGEVLKKKIAGVCGRDAIFETTDEFFAHAVSERLGETYVFSEKAMCEILKNKPSHPEKYNCFMDHAYFSATVLLKKLFDELDLEMTPADIDVLSAILMHNSLYKFSIAFYKNAKLNNPIKCELHPLAYMLMLCDELQCWDRTAYGRNSRSKLYPMDCDFDFTDNKLSAVFIYDIKENYKGDAINEMLETDGKDGEFLAEIKTIVDASILGIRVSARWDERRQGKKRTYLSDSDFLHLYYFAVALSGRWSLAGEWKNARISGQEREFINQNTSKFVDAFNELSIEYKISNINQAKAFDRYLHEIGAFYSDRPVDFPELESFTLDECLKIGPIEHERWLREHIDMGWGYEKGISGDERELRRLHADMIPDDMLGDGLTSEKAKAHYDMLSKAEQDKDIEPMNAMLVLLKQFDGVRIYRLN